MPFRPKNGEVWSASAAMIASPTDGALHRRLPGGWGEGGGLGVRRRRRGAGDCAGDGVAVGGGVDSVGVGVGPRRRPDAAAPGAAPRAVRPAGSPAPASRRSRRAAWPGAPVAWRARGRRPRANGAAGRGRPPVGDGPVVCGGSSTTRTAPTSAKSTAGVTAMRL